MAKRALFVGVVVAAATLTEHVVTLAAMGPALLVAALAFEAARRVETKQGAGQ
jgi:hypothetical protein